MGAGDFSAAPFQQRAQAVCLEQYPLNNRTAAGAAESANSLGRSANHLDDRDQNYGADQ